MSMLTVNCDYQKLVENYYASPKVHDYNMDAGIAAGVFSISTGGDRGGRRGYPDDYLNIDPIFTEMKLNYLIGYIFGDGLMQ